MSIERCWVHKNSFNCANCGERAQCCYDSFSTRHTVMHIGDGPYTESCRPKNLPFTPRKVAVAPIPAACTDGADLVSDMRQEMAMLVNIANMIALRYCALHHYIEKCTCANNGAMEEFSCVHVPHLKADGGPCKIAAAAKAAFEAVSPFEDINAFGSDGWDDILDMFTTERVS